MKTRIIVFTLSVLCLNGFSQTIFTADINDGRNVVKFESEAPLETIIGITNKIGVILNVNPNDITKNAKGKASVVVGSLKTGIDLRDQDMKSESFLNVEKFPTADFTLTNFTNSSSTELKDGSKITATANGKLTIHGVTKDISVPVVLNYLKESTDTKARTKGNLLIVNTTFTINMTDYGLKIPALLFYKLKDEIKITISFVSTDAEKTITSAGTKEEKTNSVKSDK